ncbi:MAG TPA: excinuclease ABC subunit UvrC [Gaiellaceae bacterium]|nr:excinuclease ABC subunit UvrC [Gaiellaceae bacterium]
MASEQLEAQLKRVPATSGVYLFRDAAGDVLYVGKAKTLRPRVRSYFQAGSSDTRQGIRAMASRVETIETIVTSSEVEALHLEQNLVKRHRPPFNVRLRDDKSFPYIAVTVEDDYPRVMFTRERHRRGVWYFGPFANAKKVRETLDVLNRVFRYRPCEGPQPGRHSGIPCLDFHIERCHAPCVGYISKEDYREVIDQVIEFLSGDDRPIRRRLEQEMRAAAAEERFEDAARYRNRLHAIERLSERQAVERPSAGSFDVIGIAVSPERAAVQVFPLREGRMVDRYSFHLENAAGEELGEVLEQFCLEYYGVAPSIPQQIVVPRGAGDTAALEGFLTERRGSRVEVRTPERGEKRRLQELAQQNAKLALDSETFVAETKRARRLESLEELREALNLESLPIRIECFDISNIQGQEIVGSMVVFQDAVAKRSHYRKFTVRRLDGQDDFGAMREVISRRFSRLGADVGSDEWNESFATTPNLVVIDGGKGQLSAALAAMQELELPRVAVISLAKRIEEVFVPGRSEPVLLPRESPALQLLQRVRDEAHRFAITFHRQRRDVAARASMFDQLDGVGPVRRRALLQHFGSAERVVEATQEELEGVPGVPAKTARRIYAQLHRTGRA